MKKISEHLFSLAEEEFMWYTEGPLRNVPGVKVLFDPVTNEPLSVDISRSHLPLLEGKWIQLNGNPPSPNLTSIKYPFSLHLYQQQAIDFARSRPASGLFHGLGMGKTVIALGALDYPTIGVCPTAATKVWAKEAKKLGLSIQILKGLSGQSSKIEKGKDIYLTTYGSCHVWLPLFRKFGAGPTVYSKFADEAHGLHLKKGKVSQAFNSIAVPQTILLTATPVRNRLKSLHGLIEGLEPRGFGYLSEFRARYCGSFINEHGFLVDGNPTHTEELAKRLTEIAIYESWLNPDLQHLRPTNIRHSLDIDIPIRKRSQALQKAISRAFDTFRGKDGQGGIQMSYLTAQRAAIGEMKSKAICTSPIMDDLMDQHPRTIWWVYHKESARLLTETLKAKGRRPVDTVTGATTDKARDRILEEWEEGDPLEGRDLVATMSSLNSAVNLVSAGAAVVLEQSWAPIELQQLEARHHRPGNSHKEVHTYYFTVPNTIDSKISRALLEKIEEHEAAFGASDQKAQMLMLTGLDSMSDKQSILKKLI